MAPMTALWRSMPSELKHRLSSAGTKRPSSIWRARAVDHLAQKGPRAQVPLLAFERVHVAQQARLARRIRQQGVRPRIRHQPNFADRTELGASRQVIEIGRAHV